MSIHSVILSIGFPLFITIPYTAEINIATNITSIFVTHDQEEALEVADRVVLMNHGQIEQAGSPQEVWDKPASPFVYGFLGNVNLFHGRIHGGELHIGQEGSALSIRTPHLGDAHNVRAFAYVRPHELDVQPNVPGAKGMPAQLTRTMVMGSVARLELHPLGDTGLASGAVIEAHITADTFRAQGFKEGDILRVVPRTAQVFVDQAACI